MTCARCGSEGFGCYECTPDPYAIIARLTADRDAWSAESADNLRKLVAATARIDAMRDDIITLGAQVNSLMRERDAALAQVPGVVIHHLRTILDEAEHHLPGSVAQNNIIYAANKALDALTPADATAALDRIKRQARAEGLRMAAQIAVDFDGGDVSNPWEWPNRIAAAILAAAEQEGQGDE